MVRRSPAPWPAATERCHPADDQLQNAGFHILAFVCLMLKNAAFLAHIEIL